MEHIFRTATIKDVAAITPLLRSEDVQEVMAASGKHPSYVLPDSLNEDTRVWLHGKDYVALYGITHIASEIAAPWMVATDLLQRYPKLFIETSRLAIREWNERFPLLVNCVDARNTLHIEWLKWSGFHFTHLHKAWGAAKVPFWQFEKRTHV